MGERPILFSGVMVRAIREGRKTQTRRLVKPSPGRQRTWLTSEGIDAVPHGEMSGDGWQMHHPRAGTKQEYIDRNGERKTVDVEHDSPLGWIRSPYGIAGDRLWVREAFAVPPGSDRRDEAAYRADFTEHDPGGWTPSIHMPRWASRITLEVTGVRVERLQDISADDVFAEGVQLPVTPDGALLVQVPNPHRPSGKPDTWTADDYARLVFAPLWDSINGKRGGWASNPWCWVVSFKPIEAKC